MLFRFKRFSRILLPIIALTLGLAYSDQMPILQIVKPMHHSNSYYLLTWMAIFLCLIASLYAIDKLTKQKYELKYIFFWSVFPNSILISALLMEQDTKPSDKTIDMMYMLASIGLMAYYVTMLKKLFTSKKNTGLWKLAGKKVNH